MHDTCPRCGSDKVIPDLPLAVDVHTADGPGGGSADVRLEGRPQAWIFKDPAYGGLTARVCGACGHAELYARNFRALYEKYETTRGA
ncbi:MAG TPA: hypothetical protein VM597_13865 [Gemmataceae bacterium]|jgi:uncharacterized OB-fold protein|nr:hypothetical protein [Gemmataceae bacterium]